MTIRAPHARLRFGAAISRARRSACALALTGTLLVLPTSVARAQTPDTAEHDVTETPFAAPEGVADEHAEAPAEDPHEREEAPESDEPVEAPGEAAHEPAAPAEPEAEAAAEPAEAPPAPAPRAVVEPLPEPVIADEQLGVVGFEPPLPDPSELESPATRGPRRRLRLFQTPEGVSVLSNVAVEPREAPTSGGSTPLAPREEAAPNEPPPSAAARALAKPPSASRARRAAPPLTPGMPAWALWTLGLACAGVVGLVVWRARR